ncbi:hypothetical protein NN3_13540 [Nocardia neocaledoniensis NBRC 108232]|uniref:hypothetical protein n=1 Tax=Nocardia neocaledoniensis TaxID=236511 RepID=UPI00119122E6|nr:hypothetical protein [Nocardia neocaledoniensis]GEM30347.1 hypothetical protein NN3_13540 [Nocardia neocaledoniensis NBRC 108232]
MRSPTDHTARLRGAAVGAASGAVAVLAHGLGGATGLPSGSSATLLLAACALIGVVVSALPRGNTALSTMAVLALGQVVGHTALSLGHAQHQHTFSAAMLLAHLVAIPVGALAIRAAEVGVRRAITSVRRLVRVLGGGPSLFVRSVVAPVPDERAVLRQLLVRPGLGVRGPPSVGVSVIHPVPA